MVIPVIAARVCGAPNGIFCMTILTTTACNTTTTGTTIDVSNSDSNSNTGCGSGGTSGYHRIVDVYVTAGLLYKYGSWLALLLDFGRIC